ncbi:MAG: PKD domain-containing protein [Thermoanaerobaculia bacterium]|nr:MAG: PKD domain-containing protein [Thermoanaerobaculia bacterium]
MAKLRRSLPALALLLTGLLLPACEEGTPVGPEGMILRISAYPTRIGKTGSSTITLQALRSNGIPVNPGTEIRLSSNIGVVDAVVYTNDDGVATGTLRGDGRVGTATVSAYSGGVEPVTTEVAVGALATSISLTVDPTSLPETGGVVHLRALVRDENGQPLPDASVNFTTEAGTLASGGRFLTTNANGEVTDRLTVDAADVQSQPDRIITVTAESGGASGVISDSADVTIQAPPIASFTFTIASGNIVSFTDTSTGAPTSWAWDFDSECTDATFNPTSTAQNPVNIYPGPGDYVVMLRVRNAFGSSDACRVVDLTP